MENKKAKFHEEIQRGDEGKKWKNMWATRINCKSKNEATKSSKGEDMTSDRKQNRWAENQCPPGWGDNESEEVKQTLMEVRTLRTSNIQPEWQENLKDTLKKLFGCWWKRRERMKMTDRREQL